MSNSAQTENPPLLVDAPSNGEELENGPTPMPAHQYCVFRSGAERYLLSVVEVEEVVEWPGIALIPLAPSYLMGIFNLRGVIVPVLDIAHQERCRASQPPTHLVVAAWGGEAGRGVVRVGLAADEMFGAYMTSEPILVEEAPGEVVHCRGILRHEKSMALALDLGRLAEAFPIPAI